LIQNLAGKVKLGHKESDSHLGGLNRFSKSVIRVFRSCLQISHRNIGVVYKTGPGDVLRLCYTLSELYTDGTENVQNKM
jgi:hypothetical protein